MAVSLTSDGGHDLEDLDRLTPSPADRPVAARRATSAGAGPMASVGPKGAGMLLRGIAGAILLLAPPASAQPSRVVWAWERPEALETLPPGIGIASVAGFIRLRADAIVVRRGRRFALLAAPDRPAPVAVVHIEIDQNRALAWTDLLARQVVSAALGFARGAPQVQVDMEVRASQRAALLDVLHGLRTGLAPGTVLSMTALASWCESETWLDQAPVDEIVPMLFRMGQGGARLRAKLAAGGDFVQPRCRGAVGIALDSPIAVRPGRRLYIFNPRPWDAAAVAALGPE